MTVAGLFSRRLDVMCSRSTVLREGRYLLHTVAGFLRGRRSYIRRKWPGLCPRPQSARHAVFVHFDKGGIVFPYVMKHLHSLVEAGYWITFVSNSPKFPASSAGEVAPLCREVIWRHNIGYDFGAYKDGIAQLGDLSKIDQLILLNDSVYGPFRPVKDVIAEIDSTDVDFSGITDSWQHSYHVQSYFMLFSSRAIRAPAFARFWRELLYVNWKPWVIRHGEIELTRSLARQKLRSRVLAPYWDVAARALEKSEKALDEANSVGKSSSALRMKELVYGIPMNSVHVFWGLLITDFGVPYIKREVIEKNPTGQPYVWQWPDLIGAVSSYDVQLILQHLQSL